MLSVTYLYMIDQCWLFMYICNRNHAKLRELALEGIWCLNTFCHPTVAIDQLWTEFAAASLVSWMRSQHLLIEVFRDLLIWESGNRNLEREICNLFGSATLDSGSWLRHCVLCEQEDLSSVAFVFSTNEISRRKENEKKKERAGRRKLGFSIMRHNQIDLDKKKLTFEDAIKRPILDTSPSQTTSSSFYL